MDPTVERKLIEKVRKGNRKAFDRIMLEYQGRVYYTSLRMLRSHEDAMDAAQDVFLKVWQRCGSLTGEMKLYAWLYRITVNTCLDRLRWRKRHQATQEVAIEFVG